MSEWVDRIKKHSVWEGLEQLGPQLDKAKRSSLLDSKGADAIERVRTVLALCGKRLASIDPVLLTEVGLSHIQGALTGVSAEVVAFNSDKDSKHLINAAQQCDGILAALATLISVETPEDLTVLSEATASYRNTLQELLAAVQIDATKAKESVGSINENLALLTAKIDSENQRITAQMGAFQTDFAKAQADYQQKIADLITERQGAIDKLTGDYSSKFVTAQEDRVKEFSENEETRKKANASMVAEFTQKLDQQNLQFDKERDAIIKNFNEDIAKLEEQYLGSASSILKQIENNRDEVANLLGVIGNTGVTSGYLKVANQARVAAYVFQGLTVFALAAFILFAGSIVFFPLNPNQDFLHSMATRVFLSIAIGIFAAYAARQADKYLLIERPNRKLALELAAVGPYIEPLQPEERNKFRLELANRSFGLRDGGGDLKIDDKNPVSVVDLVKVVGSPEVMGLVKEITKMVKS